MQIFALNLVPFSKLRYEEYSLRRERERTKHRAPPRAFTATRRGTVTSGIGDQEVNLRIKWHISYIDEYVVPLIFKYLIAAKNVEIRLACTFDNE